MKKIANKGYFKYHKYFNSTLVAKFIVDKSVGINSKFYWNK